MKTIQEIIQNHISTYLVPFEECETVWVKYNAIIEATSQLEAYNKVKALIAENDSPHREVDCEFVEIVEHVESKNKFTMDDCSVEDAEVVDDRIRCELKLTAFDIARYGKSTLYHMAEKKFAKVGLILDITEMELIPISINEHFVTYDAIPVDYIQTWSNGDHSIVKNNEMITPLHESLLLVNENVMSTSCGYNRSTAIKLPISFDIQRIDKRMKELKTDVVTYRENTYIVGIFDGGYALWECEV